VQDGYFGEREALAVGGCQVAENDGVEGWAVGGGPPIVFAAAEGEFAVAEEVFGDFAVGVGVLVEVAAHRPEDAAADQERGQQEYDERPRNSGFCRFCHQEGSRNSNDGTWSVPNT
jgi:hypothetical protein